MGHEDPDVLAVGQDPSTGISVGIECCLPVKPQQFLEGVAEWTSWEAEMLQGAEAEIAVGAAVAAVMRVMVMTTMMTMMEEEDMEYMDGVILELETPYSWWLCC